MVSELASHMLVLAVAVALVVAVLGYITGFLATPPSRTSSLVVLPDTSLDPLTGTLCIHLSNKGLHPAEVYLVEIPGVGRAQVTMIIRPGGTAEECLVIPGARGLAAGSRYMVRVYTKTGSIAVGYVVAVPGSTPSTAAAGSAGGSGGGYGLVTVYVSSASSSSVTLDGSIVFEAAEPGTLVFTDSSTVSYGEGATVEIESLSSQLGGPGGETSIVELSTAGDLSLSYIPADRVYFNDAQVSSDKTLKCLSSGSADTCSSRKVSAFDITGTITIELQDATVMVTVNGSTVLAETGWSGRIVLSQIDPVPPTRILYDPDATQLEITGVKARVAIQPQS